MNSILLIVIGLFKLFYTGWGMVTCIFLGADLFHLGCQIYACRIFPYYLLMSSGSIVISLFYSWYICLTPLDYSSVTGEMRGFNQLRSLLSLKTYYTVQNCDSEPHMLILILNGIFISSLPLIKHWWHT